MTIITRYKTSEALRQHEGYIIDDRYYDFSLRHGFRTGFVREIEHLITKQEQVYSPYSKNELVLRSYSIGSDRKYHLVFYNCRSFTAEVLFNQKKNETALMTIVIIGISALARN